MILRSWCELIFTKNGNYSSKQSAHKFHINEINCDKCGVIFIESEKKAKERLLIESRYYCADCRLVVCKTHLKKVGLEVLKKFSKEKRKEIAISGGKASQLKSPKNKGQFSSERWNNLSEIEQKSRVKKASNALQKKLNNDEEFKRKHYLKIFKNSRIGFTSKGHNELHYFLIDYDFEQHVVISNMETDECNEKLKIVIEFNGDMYHCNPRIWKPDQYNSVIKMTAKDKWEKDRKRIYKLKNLGYITFIVWEEDWANKRDFIKEKLINFINKRKNEINKN